MGIAREWTAFAGVLFSLMGVSLSAASRRNAEDALSWERQWRAAVGVPEPVRGEKPQRQWLELVYHMGGLFFIGIGIGLLYSAATGRAPFAVRSGARETLVGGIIFTACGVVMALNAWLRGGRRGPRFLEGELLADEAPLPLGERVAAVCGHAITALFLAFGLRLLREGLR